ncbi:hypothetical protein HPB50_001361 [Hyalomma asiaticum]|uniref:Uncharacterized protein n=1 Tax=Hyalomma asiaticum TaxID=266040 RepID=A0ACB7RTH0_HYAAI|nr:hypothetical protein HPB50_001361 [Hyalomma asiaticum]
MVQDPRTTERIIECPDDEKIPGGLCPGVQPSKCKAGTLRCSCIEGTSERWDAYCVPHRDCVAPVSRRRKRRGKRYLQPETSTLEIKNPLQICPKVRHQSVSPLRCPHSETERKRAESVACPSMFPQLVNRLEVLRTRQERAERLIGLAELHPFPTNSPLPPATVKTRETLLSAPRLLRMP